MPLTIVENASPVFRIPRRTRERVSLKFKLKSPPLNRMAPLVADAYREKQKKEDSDI